MPRYTDAQRDHIRGVVLELYLRGIRPPEIARYLAEKEGTPLQLRQVHQYLAEVKEEMRRQAQFDRAEQVGKAVNRLESLYRKSEAAGQYGVASQIQGELNRLLGLIINRMEHSGSMAFERWLRSEDPQGTREQLPSSTTAQITDEQATTLATDTEDNGANGDHEGGRARPTQPGPDAE